MLLCAVEDLAKAQSEQLCPRLANFVCVNFFPLNMLAHLFGRCVFLGLACPWCRACWMHDMTCCSLAYDLIFLCRILATSSEFGRPQICGPSREEARELAFSRHGCKGTLWRRNLTTRLVAQSLRARPCRSSSFRCPAAM